MLYYNPCAMVIINKESNWTVRLKNLVTYYYVFKSAAVFLILIYFVSPRRYCLPRVNIPIFSDRVSGRPSQPYHRFIPLMCGSILTSSPLEKQIHRQQFVYSFSFSGISYNYFYQYTRDDFSSLSKTIRRRQEEISFNL